MNRSILNQVKAESGVDIRNPSTAFFGVSSGDRSLDYKNTVSPITGRPAAKTQTPYALTLTSSQNYLNGAFTRVALTEFSFTWSIPTITNRNNLIGFAWDVSGNEDFDQAVQTVFTLTNGWYTPAILAATLQAKIRGIPGVTGLGAATVTFDATTGSYYLNTGSTTTACFFRTNQAGTNPITLTEPNRIQLFDMMNWYAPNGSLSQPYATRQRHISGVSTLLSTQFIDIVSDNLTYSQDVKDGDTGEIVRDVVARIYLQGQDNLSPSSIGQSPFSIYRNFPFPKQIKWAQNLPIAQLAFNLYDDRGFPLGTYTNYAVTDLSGNFVNATFNDAQAPDWNMSLLVTEV